MGSAKVLVKKKVPWSTCKYMIHIRLSTQIPIFNTIQPCIVNLQPKVNFFYSAPNHVKNVGSLNCACLLSPNPLSWQHPLLFLILALISCHKLTKKIAVVQFENNFCQSFLKIHIVYLYLKLTIFVAYLLLSKVTHFLG